jgi:hypothetical protein
MYMRRGGIFLRRSDRWEFMGGVIDMKLGEWCTSWGMA